jgi:hypothetical protein
MSYLKQTIVSGYRADERKLSILAGHWADESVLGFARRTKLDLQTVEFRHNITDMSGHGRGEEGARFRFDNNNQAIKVTDAEAYDDSQDVWDSMEEAK